MDHNKVRTLVIYALFIALTFILGLTPVGLIPLGVINVTTLCIPTIVGTIMMGLKGGLLLGVSFGTTSLISALGPAPSYIAAGLLEIHIVCLLVVCYVPRLLVPLVTYGIYRLLSARKPGSKINVGIAAVLGSLTNTVFYLGLAMLFFALSSKLDLVDKIITGTAFIAGPVEALAAALIAMPVVAALQKIQK